MESLATPAELSLPYADDFERPPPQPGRYFSDIYGAFEITACAAGRPGQCLRQATLRAPYPWNDTGYRPFTIMGSQHWKNYRVTVDVLWERSGAIDLMARLTGMSAKDMPNAYVLRVSDTGAWKLLRSTMQNEEEPLASGKVETMGTDTWHRLGLKCQDDKIGVEIDDMPIQTVTDARHAQGMIGLGTNEYLPAEFARLRIDPVP